jgi:hypothetical protein
MTSTPTLDIAVLEQIANDLKARKEFADTSDFADEYSPLILPILTEYFEEVIKQDGVLGDHEGYEITLGQHGVAEILLCHIERGIYYPSVSSPWWEAKISSVDTSDPDIGTPKPAVALAWGLVDVLINLFGADIEEE